jgi:hypothetical protein
MVGRGKKKFINEKDKPIEPCSLVARPQKSGLIILGELLDAILLSLWSEICYVWSM